MSKSDESDFPIPSSLQDLERAPYNLLPYPHDFDDDDEAARADSFSRLVDLVDQGNEVLLSEGMSLFQPYEGQTPWMSNVRVQAMYTLVRKSTSLAPSTRWGLINCLCQTVKALSSILDEESKAADLEENGVAGSTTNTKSTVVSQQFRDAYACHLYMLFSVMFFMESEAKVGNGISGGSRRNDDASHKETEEITKMRSTCAQAMLNAALSMSRNRSMLWKRGVPLEAVVILPCRIAYIMLESASGVIARKAASGDEALGMIAATVDGSENLMGTVLAALMDMLHSFEHMAPICAELCTMVSEKPVNRLGTELIREIGRLDTSGATAGDGAKASGIKNVAPFISELAQRRPKLVLSNVAQILPLLDAEPYNLRSSIVSALAYILQDMCQTEKPTPSEEAGEEAVSSEVAVRPNIEKTRVTLLEILEVRSHDVSSYTRSAVLKAWISLVQSGAVPIERIHAVTEMTIDRLQDKTVIVRKQALQLLTVLLENNPFMGDLDPEPYRQKLAELYGHIKQNLPSAIKEAYENALREAKEDGQDEEALMQLEQATLAAAIAEAENPESDDSSNVDVEFRAKVEALKFAQKALEFIAHFEDASMNLHGMLLSSNSSDVTEALRFFVKARHFKLPCAVTGMKQALNLMWSSEQNIKDEVLKAFVDVFIAKPGSDGEEPLPSNQIAYNLLVLAGEATVSELASIEEAVRCLVKDERLPAEVFSVLWIATAKGTSNSRATAIHVLAMAAVADKSIVESKSRLKSLLDTALGDYTEERRDWKVARAASIALQRIDRAVVDESCAKYLVLERIIERLCDVARGDWCVDNDKSNSMEWFSAAEQAVAALFVVSPEPEVACTSIIQGMCAQTLGATELESCSPLRLARFFHVLGHIALKLLVYTEVVSGAVRRANAKKSLKKQEEADQKKSKGSAAGEDDQIEAELGMAAEIEAENERKVADITEKEIVGRGLLGLFGPILVRVASNEGGKFDNEILRQTSTLALCKFMCVSASYCEKHLPVVFSTLASAPADDVVLRANTVIALGDLAFRFPNEVEPYAPRIYACLRDSSTKVRRHTLMVLTHLILNDMVKVKGQVCEIALCLRDDDQRIRDTARLLFHELSKRSNNPIYNLLPEIISQLSNVNLEKEQFRGIMAFLLGFVKKERQNETLIDKLCQRFPKCTSIRQTADIAFCISQMKVNEKSLKTLVDNFKLYKDGLYDEDVKRHFASVATKAKKLAKPEMKQILEEWESKLSEQSRIGMENMRAGEQAAKAKGRALRRGVRKIATIQESEEDDDSESDGDETEEDDENELLEDDIDDKENEVFDFQSGDSEVAKGKSRRHQRGLQLSESQLAQ
eukprot:Nitzschia sp. Nitz4//scaffold11_size288233//220686//224851//NITZ4_000804-RA/size288233-snap-gene-0.58-mRNA-1//-1//CDS//3329534164//7512//frame0